MVTVFVDHRHTLLIPGVHLGDAKKCCWEFTNAKVLISYRWIIQIRKTLGMGKRTAILKSILNETELF